MDESISSITTSLLARAQANDKEGWDRLVYLFSPLVYKWARKEGVSPEDAADVGQEVFAAVARGLSGFRKDKPNDTFIGWLRVVTRNKVIDHWRKANGQPSGKGGSEANVEMQQIASLEERDSSAVSEEVSIVYRRILEVIQGEFDEQNWQAFQMLVVEGLDAANVANQMDISRNQVYLAKSRILRRIREEFEL